MADLSNFDRIPALFKQIVDEDGRKIDGVVHSAGAVKLAPIRTLSKSVLEEMMVVNFYSFAGILKCAATKNLFQKNASIVGISSDVAITGQKGNGAYGASKAAMNGLMKTAALELNTMGIRVNTISLGGVNTDILIQKPSDPDRLLQPEEVANIAAFYLSPMSAPVTGECIGFQKI